MHDKGCVAAIHYLDVLHRHLVSLSSSKLGLLNLHTGKLHEITMVNKLSL